MGLSSDLISQFVKITKDDKKVNKETTVYGTIVYDGKAYVKLDGSDLLTPISTTANVKDGERVTVMIKDHTATVTGNISSPSARTEDVDNIANQVSEFEIVIAHRVTTDDLQATNAIIDNLIAVTGKYDELEAVTAEIETLRAEFIEGKTLDVEDIEAVTAKIESIEAEFGEFTVVSTEDLEAFDAEITNLKGYTADFTYISAIKASVKELDAEKLSVKDADIKYAKIDDLDATYAKIVDLNATNATVETLDADVADINTLIFGSASGEVIQTEFANAVIAQLGNAQIKAAMIQSIDADQINAGDISTNKMRVVSDDGKLVISDETIQISDDNRVRVQIGKDSSNDYSINIWDESGNLMFSKGGITDKAIKDAIIRNDMVSDDANISASKLNISSLFTEINNSTETIKSTKIYLDDEKQTLDVAFTQMSSDLDDTKETVSSQGTQLSVIQGKIESKVWEQDINDATGELSTRLSTVEQDIDGITTTVGSHTTQIEDIKNTADQNAEDVNDLIARVTTAETNIEQTSEQISLRATKTEVAEAVSVANAAKEAADTAVMEATVNLRIDSSRGTVFKNNTLSTVLSAVIYKGSKRITDITALHEEFGSGAYLQWLWQRMNEQTFGTILSSDSRIGADGFTFTLSPEDVDTKVVFMCQLITD